MTSMKGRDRSAELPFGQGARLDLGGTFLAVYLGTSPVYWFANVPVQLVSAIKYVLVAIAVMAIWIRIVRLGRIILPFDLTGPPGLVFALFSMSTGFLQSDVGVVASRFYDVALAFLFIWTMYIYVLNGGSAIRVLGLASVVILPFCALVVSAGLLGIPNWPAPFLGSGFTIADTGLGGVRTGWSFGVSLFLPICLVTSEQIGRASPRHGLLFVVVSTVVIVGSQLVTGGRSGLVASLIVLVVWQLVRPIRRWAWLLPAYSGALLALDWAWVSWRLRFDILSGGAGYATLNRFSGGRLDVLAAAVDAFLAKPFTGYGFEQTALKGIQTAGFIHNGWLRIGVEAGVLAIVGHLVLAGAFIVKGFQVYVHANRGRGSESMLAALGLGVMLVIVATLTVSMFEPGIFFGTFQTRALLFAGVGAVSAHAAHREMLDSDVVGDRSKGIPA